MPENKTQATDVSVDAHLAAIEDEGRRQDCAALVNLMSKVTRAQPRMWGPSIVGFGTYHYRYDSGREGESCVTGFSSRRGALSIYLTASGPGQDQLLAKLGKHKMGKACLYIRRLTDVDMAVLEALVRGSMAEVRRRYPSP